MLLTLIVFILVFGVVVIAHELGHFLIAKLNGIRVVEFAVGMGPAICKFTKGETRYVLRLLPLGGACMFEGEDGIYTETAKEEGAEPVKQEGAFNEANVWARIAKLIMVNTIVGIPYGFVTSIVSSIVAAMPTGPDRSSVDSLP